jgi:hypothetical protein
MHIVRRKDGKVIAIASRKEDAIAVADGSRIDKTEYVIQESTAQKEVGKNK